jgi:putative ATP-binding cassette transporter
MFKLNWKNVFFLSIVAIPNTLFSFGILFIINSIVLGKEHLLPADNTGAVFFLVVALSFALNVFFQKKIIRYTYDLIYKNELIIFKSLQQTSLNQLEKTGSERIYGIIEDVRLFIYLPNIITSTISSLMALLMCLTYYFILSTTAALIVISLIATVTLVYMLVNKRLMVHVILLRKLNDIFFKIVDDALKGFKELKLSKIKSTNLFEKYLRNNREDVRNIESNVVNQYLILNLFSQYGIYLLLGIILFVLPMVNLLAKEEVISFVIILLFITGPITTLINMQNYYTKAFVANKRITNFLKDINDRAAEPPSIEENGSNNLLHSGVETIHELRFENVSYRYDSTSFDQSFVLGPINLTIKKGETIFIIGGNGSGKSTFINCLTGLYSPSHGSIYLNDHLISNTDQRYRSQISAIFTDNHLFSQNYDDYSLTGNKRYEQLLNIMALDKVVLDDREESARRKFSKGQSKRMAMIFSLLEDCPILVLDEWAADQDPHFRRYFYEKLLPQLKKEGKTIIAVTHDDAYFKYADRLIKFDYGHIIRDIRVHERPLEIETIWEV